jgi:hypothetical protein
VTRARFSREARSELLAQTAYYETIRRGHAHGFGMKLKWPRSWPQRFPLHGKPAAGGTRRPLVVAFPFKLFYTETDHGILIHAVAGDHQFPEYWLGRMPSED